MADEGAQKLWTPANKVTLARILAIPLFIVVVVSPWPQYLQLPEFEAWKPIIAAAVFIAISATDAIDGHLARSRNEVTTLGKFMDPLADKILVAAALLALIELQVLPSWVALIILAREFIVSGIRMVAASEGVVIAASMWGKVKTVTQIIAVTLFLVKMSPLIGGVYQDLDDALYLLAWATMVVALFFTIVSMLDYFSKARDLLGFTPKARPQDVSGYPYMSVAGAARESDEEAPVGGAADRAAGAAQDGEETPIKATDAADGAGVSGEAAALAAAVLDAARAAGKTLGTAESCTGGLIAGALTSVPGSSDVVAGGIVSYSNDVKRMQLGVREDTLREHGAVSAQTACEMAQGARQALGVDVAVSVTGIAGPGGAVPGKPVGTVFVGCADEAGVHAVECHFDGGRDGVRVQTVIRALEELNAAVKA